MKTRIPVPYDKLVFFQKQLELQRKEVEILRRYGSIFFEKRVEFADHFYDYFNHIDDTRLVLAHEREPGRMKRVWQRWFGAFFGERFGQADLPYLWQSGLRHVEVNLDQRYLNLGYAKVREFCRRIIEEESVCDSDAVPLAAAVDKLVDLCLLIETNAYMVATSQCDREVVNGIFHQVRNPITVIGGNISRLKKKVGPQSPMYRVYDAIMSENRRLERMVINIGVYSEMFQKDPRFSENSVRDLISVALDRLESTDWHSGIHLEIDVVPDNLSVMGDSQDLETMFFYLMQNSVEAVDESNPYIRITAKIDELDERFVGTEIFNAGTPPSQEELENLFVPFYSSKPYGTGFGLPIAQLAARRSHGDLALEPVGDRGTRCIIKLPNSDFSSPEAQVGRPGEER